MNKFVLSLCHVALHTQIESLDNSFVNGDIKQERAKIEGFVFNKGVQILEITLRVHTK